MLLFVCVVVFSIAADLRAKGCPRAGEKEIILTRPVGALKFKML